MYVSAYIDREVNTSQKGKTNKIFEVLPWPSSPVTNEVLTSFVLLSQQCAAAPKGEETGGKKDKALEEWGVDPACPKPVHQSTASGVGSTHTLLGVVSHCNEP